MAFNDTLELNYEKINKVRKHFKKNNNIFELILINYENINYYFRFDYNKKTNNYYVNSINLNLVDDNFKEYINQQHIMSDTANFMLSIIPEISISEYDSLDQKIDSDIVIFNASLLDLSYHLKFNKYIPLELMGLANTIILLFSNLPKRFDPIFNELISSLNNTSYKYEYKKEFSFDLYRGKLSKIFNDVIEVRGSEYFKEKRILFLEKIDNKFFACIRGKEQDKYMVVIEYDNKLKIMRVYCTCPCEFYCKHIYATILAIRKKKFKNFYKVRYIKENEYAYERITNFNFLLSTGAKDDLIELVSETGEILLAPIFDKNNNPMFEIMEDDKNKTLHKLTNL